MPIRVLIADDHGVVRAGLRALLVAEPDLQVVGEAASGDEAVRLAVRRQPDVALMDISMPGLDGIEVTRSLAEQVPKVRVLLLTVHEDPALLREALRAGAAGYVIKRAVESELINAIRATAAGDLYVHPSLTRSLLEQKGTDPANNGALASLTPREIEVLRLIAEGYTNTQTAELLHLSPRTIETHRANIRAKLHLDSRADLVRFAARHGLLNITNKLA
jgi:DNA-binding NarL/FixJ family response regulator